MVTIKELSAELQISKTSVSNLLCDLDLKDKLIKDGNRNLIPDDVADKVRQAFNAKKKSTPASNVSADVIEILSDQLKEKDRQIDMLMRQIEQLQAQNGSLLQTVQQGNYLLANTLGVADPKEKEPAGPEKDEQSTEPETKSTGFFRRWFRK